MTTKSSNILRRTSAPFRPMNERLRPTHVDRQHEFYAEAAKRYYETTLLASGIHGIIYTALTTGIVCTCAKSANLSLLYADGQMKPTTIDKIMANVTHLDRVMFTADDLNEKDHDINFDPDIEQLDPEEDIIGYGSSEQSRCAICWGTYYVSGYHIFNGYHESLIDPYETDHNKILTNPVCYNGGTYANFITEIPDVPNTKATIRMWDKDDLVDSDLYTYSEPVLGQEGLLSIQTQEQWTNVEIALIPYRGVPIDFEQIQDLLSINIENSQLTTTINVNSPVGVTVGSVIRDDKFFRAWQVITVNPFYDNYSNLVYNSCECRLIGRQELWSNLLL